MTWYGHPYLQTVTFRLYEHEQSQKTWQVDRWAPSIQWHSKSQPSGEGWLQMNDIVLTVIWWKYCTPRTGRESNGGSSWKHDENAWSSGQPRDPPTGPRRLFQRVVARTDHVAIQFFTPSTHRLSRVYLSIEYLSSLPRLKDLPCRRVKLASFFFSVGL